MSTNSDYQRKLLKKWSMIVESTPAGCSKINSVQDKINLAAVLENTYKYLRQHGCFLTEASGTNTVNPVLTNKTPAYDAKDGVLGPNDFVFPNLITPMIRRIYPTLMAHELVSVQPMNGPVGYAMALRVMGPNGNNPDYPNQNFEYGYEGTVGTTGRKIEPGSSSAAGSKFSRRGAGVRGAGRPTSDAEGFGKDPVFGRFGQSGERGVYPTATINIVKQLVQAEERKLGSEWSPELAEDFEAMYGIDIETEMVNNISFQIGAETDQQILDAMVDAGSDNTVTWDAATADGIDQMGRISTLLTSVTKAANDIAITTRRGSGNFVVASVNVCSALQQLGSQKLVSDGKTMPSVPASSIGSLSKEGLINNGRQLLVKDTYATVDYALVGYKGTQTGDSGIIYCPYIPVTLVKTLDPRTLSPRIGARTRYGIGSNPYDSKNFYKVIQCKFDGAYTFSNDRRYFFGGSDAAGIAQSVSISEEKDLQPAAPETEVPTGAAAPKRVRKVVAE